MIKIFLFSISLLLCVVQPAYATFTKIQSGSGTASGTVTLSQSTGAGHLFIVSAVDNGASPQTITVGFSGTSQTMTDAIGSSDCTAAQHGLSCKALYVLSSASGTTGVTASDVGSNAIEISYEEWSYTGTASLDVTHVFHDNTGSTWTSATIASSQLLVVIVGSTSSTPANNVSIAATSTGCTMDAQGQPNFVPYGGISVGVSATVCSGTTAGSPPYIFSQVVGFNSTAGGVKRLRGRVIQ